MTIAFCVLYRMLFVEQSPKWQLSKKEQLKTDSIGDNVATYTIISVSVPGPGLKTDLFWAIFCISKNNGTVTF